MRRQGEVGQIRQGVHVIFANRLYLQRRDAKTGKPLYETWGAFCLAELGMTGGNAYRVMDVAVNYDRATAIARARVVGLCVDVNLAHLVEHLPQYLDVAISLRVERMPLAVAEFDLVSRVHGGYFTSCNSPSLAQYQVSGLMPSSPT